MHDARGELPDGRELLALQDLAVDPVPLRHVLADGDDVGDLVPVEPHRNLAQPEEPCFPAEPYLLLRLLDLAGLEHAIEFGPELLGRLPREHVEHRPAHDIVAAQPLGARLPFAVPALDPVVAIHHIEAERQAVYDQAGEPPVLLDLARLRGDLAGEIGRELHRRQVRREEVRHDRQHPPLGGTRGCALADLRLQQAEPRALMLERQPAPPRAQRQRVG